MTSGASKATRRDWFALSVLALPGLVYTTDLTALDVALPTISQSLQPSSAQLLWIVDIYGFMLAGFLITMGTVGGLIGRRRLLMLGTAAFVLVSFAAALAPNAQTLIALRALLGVAAATLAPSTMSLLRHLFQDQQERHLAICIWIASIASGGILGALAGGLVLHFLDWHAIFLIPVLPMMLVLIFGPTLLPEVLDKDAARLDLRSVAMSLACVLPSIQGLKLIAANGMGVMPFALIAAGLAVGTAFLRRQRRVESPLLDLSLFRRAQFAPAVAVYGLTCFALFGLFVLLIQYLQLVLTLTPLETGMATLPWPLATVVGSLAAPMLADRFGTRTVRAAGLICGLLGIAMLAAAIGRFSLLGLEAGAVVFSLGLSFVLTSAYETIVTSSAARQSGAAAAIAETASEFGGAMGIAMLGTVSTAIYRHVLAATAPNGLSQTAVAQALATLGGAHVVAAALPSGLGAPLLASARDAYAIALQFAALGAAMALAFAVWVWRHRSSVSKPDPALP